MTDLAFSGRILSENITNGCLKLKWISPLASASFGSITSIILKNQETQQSQIRSSNKNITNCAMETNKSNHEKILDDMLKILKEEEETPLEEHKPVANKASTARFNAFRCDVCSSCYSSKRNLQRHHRLKHQPLSIAEKAGRNRKLEEK